MLREELFDLLEIDSPADFDYFEQFADLMETDGDIDEELFYEVLSEVRAASLGEIIENYLEEIGKHLPDGVDDIFTLVDGIEDRLLLLAQGIDHDPSARRALAEELHRFREWYLDPGGALVDGEASSIRDAVTSAREEKLGAAPRRYDFSASLGYELRELSMSLGSYEKIDTGSGEDEEDEDI